ncbi:MAG TPA: glutamate-5-semialdehyde dehydrogenase [Pyrinomonadaceae bacterium]|nr:glutamate-5-semialdehyde dehydrogenase [Acidobacteriota bacterium]HQZ96709.1 glutamate-5-semialdehyde dehydrogenase [Pyrinomonadaceae bacterium]
MNNNSRNSILESLARLLFENKADIVAANKLDVEACPPDNEVILDRLKVSEEKVDTMIASVKSVMNSPDVVGQVISSYVREDGLRIENRRVPFGTILIIYEARPDVSIEAAIIALKAGNKILLKGGKEARNTNLFLAKLWQLALKENDADLEMVQYLDLSREETRSLIRGEFEKFDLVIPRGGEALIDFVLRNSTAPVIVSGRGNNFLYIDSEADFDMAIKIAVNGKQRLSVCNALDKILVNADLPDLDAKTLQLIAALREQNIEIIGDEELVEIDPTVTPIPDEDIWYDEFLSAKIVIGVVASTEEAIETINEYSGGHSAAIVTANSETADRFLNEVDCAAVYHNASTRFTDGGQLGLGAEIAISTQKLHFRGPLGAEHLLTNKWFVYGNGQLRN